MWEYRDARLLYDAEPAPAVKAFSRCYDCDIQDAGVIHNQFLSFMALKIHYKDTGHCAGMRLVPPTNVDCMWCVYLDDPALYTDFCARALGGIHYKRLYACSKKEWDVAVDHTIKCFKTLFGTQSIPDDFVWAYIPYTK
jgi:hypothetical protein